MPKPKKVANIRNMMMFALAVAASARSPRNCPTQIELTELDSVWRMFDASVGSANRTSVLAIGPCVRAIGRLPLAVCTGGIGPDAGAAEARPEERWGGKEGGR